LGDRGGSRRVEIGILTRERNGCVDQALRVWRGVGCFEVLRQRIVHGPAFAAFVIDQGQQTIRARAWRFDHGSRAGNRCGVGLTGHLLVF
jgi:hypothetical protein